MAAHRPRRSFARRRRVRDDREAPPRGPRHDVLVGTRFDWNAVRTVDRGHATPTNRYFGLVHQQDGFFLPILAGWDSIGMRAFGDPVQVETSEPPYGGTHMLMTDLTPVGGFVGLNAHGSTATDKFTQLDAAGVPRLLDAWRYMLTASPRN